MARRVLIEYTADHQSYSESRHEAVPIEKGTRRYVDPRSAEVLVKQRKVAKAISDDDLRAEARAEAREAASTPASAPVKPEGAN